MIKQLAGPNPHTGDKLIYNQGVEIAPGIDPAAYGRQPGANHLSHLLPLEEYDLIVILFSGGKDSLAAYLRLLELGVPKYKIEAWHHDIDGGHPTRKMDWPVTAAYVKSFAQAEEIKLRTSWRVNGFYGELYRIGASFPVEYWDQGEVKTCRLSPKQLKSEELREQILAGIDCKGELAKLGYRMKFPAKSGDLARRWCSAYLKIDIADMVLRNLDLLKIIGENGRFPAKSSIGNGRWCSPQLKREVADGVLWNLQSLRSLGSDRHKFPAKGSPHSGRWCSGAIKASVEDCVTCNLPKTRENTKVLVVSGERREESPGRAKYNEIETHRTNAVARSKRLVHQWRNVIDFTEQQVWDTIRRHGIVPHPCYAAGWNRCSCMTCIFGLPKHWAGVRELFPDVFEAIVEDEKRLGFTLDNSKALLSFVGDAKSCVVYDDPIAVQQLRTGEFGVEDIYIPVEQWKLPSGAFHGAKGGPC